MLKLMRRLLLLGIVSALAVALWRRIAAPSDASLAWTPPPAPPAPLSPVPSPVPERSTRTAIRAPVAVATWVAADDGTCPATHPVKAKLTSGIFHLPGGTNYERTKADRCYVDAAAATADGMRQSKR